MSSPLRTPNGWRCEKQASNLRRANWMDYRNPSILLITMVTTDRRPLFGELQGEKIVLTPLGKQVGLEIEQIPTYLDASAIEIYDYVVMPDHVHILLQIHERLPKHIGRYLCWFKVRCSSLVGYTTSTKPSDTNSLFAPNYHDRLLKGRNQLAHMKRYIKDNPRRLALKRANKELFRIHQDVLLNNLPCTTLGNTFLFDYPIKHVVQCSRSLTQEQIDALLDECLTQATEGIVHVTAAISEGEKQIARALREKGFPLIVLLHEGFPSPDNPQYKYYKPSGVYFEACAVGKLLLIEPHKQVLELPEVVDKTEAKVGKIPHTSQRYRFVAMNMIAEIIANHS